MLEIAFVLVGWRWQFVPGRVRQRFRIEFEGFASFEGCTEFVVAAGLVVDFVVDF